MANIGIKEFTAKNLFSKKLSIPEFQRDSAWPANKVVKLWESISEFVGDPMSDQSTEFFFLGNVVTLSKNTEIVDGQQRLTAMTIISCALRDVLAQLGETGLAEKLHHDIIRNRNTGTFRYQLNEKYRSSFNALELIQSPRSEIPLGMKITKAVSTGVAGKTQSIEFDMTGTSKWTIWDGENISTKGNVKLENFVIPGGTIKVKQSGSLTNIKADVPLSTNVASLVGEELCVGRDSPCLTDHEICEAYKRIGGLFYYNLSDVTKVHSMFKSTTITKLFPGHKEPIQLRFHFPDFEWHMPMEISEGTTLNLVETAAAGTTHSLTNERNSGGQPSHILNVYGHFTSTTTIKQCSISFPRSQAYTGADKRLAASRRAMMDRYIKVIENTKFSVTDFKAYSDALKFFTLANDGTRMEPLYNYDLLHAFSHSIVDSLKNQGPAERTASDKIKEIWGQISDNILPQKLERKKGLQLSNAILGRYCLSKDYRERSGDRYKWQITKRSTPDSGIFARLEEEVKKDPTMFVSGVFKTGCIDFFEELKENVHYHNVCDNPVEHIKDSGGKFTFLSPKVGALLTILNRKTSEIFIPLFMMILQRHKGSTETIRSAAMEECLRTIIYYIARYWVYAHHVAKSTQNVMELNPKTLYHFYTKHGGWCEKITDPATPIADIPKEVKDAFKQWESECIADGQHQPLWPIPTADSNFDVNDTDAGFLLYCFQFQRTHMKKYEDRFLRKPSSKISTHPELEHILPKSEKIKEPWWPASWPKFTKHAQWEANREKLGNRCLLEDYINRAWGTKQEWAKKSNRDPKAYSIPNSDFFKEQFPTPLPKYLSPTYIKNRSKAIWAAICGEFKP